MAGIEKNKILDGLLTIRAKRLIIDEKSRKQQRDTVRIDNFANFSGWFYNLAMSIAPEQI